MTHRLQKITALVIAVTLFIGLAAFGIYEGYTRLQEQQAKIDTASALCQTWADKLEKNRTDTGIFARLEEGKDESELPEADPWGNKLKVRYSTGTISDSRSSALVQMEKNKPPTTL